jgi:signal recognition particle GTPase
VAIARALGLPIRFIGVGEKAEDFGAFNARAFADALVDGAADESGGAGGAAREARVS